MYKETKSHRIQTVLYEAFLKSNNTRWLGISADAKNTGNILLQIISSYSNDSQPSQFDVSIRLKL